MCKNCDFTIHAAQHHFGWDNSFAPVLRTEPGRTIAFECNDASAGQLTPASTVADVKTLDFGLINPVTGPVYVEGAEPGDILKVSIHSFIPKPVDYDPCAQFRIPSDMMRQGSSTSLFQA